MIAGKSRLTGFAGGKSEHHTAACRVKYAGVAVEKLRRWKVSQKTHRQFFGNKVQARVKRRGKSSPLAEQFARHEKPHAVQDKTEEGQPARFNPRVSSHHGPAMAGPGIRPVCGTDEMNDHPG